MRPSFEARAGVLQIITAARESLIWIVFTTLGPVNIYFARDGAVAPGQAALRPFAHDENAPGCKTCLVLDIAPSELLIGPRESMEISTKHGLALIFFIMLSIPHR